MPHQRFLLRHALVRGVIFSLWLAQGVVGAAPGLPADLRDYFRIETDRLEAGCLSGIHSLDDWNRQRATFKQELLDMLGLDPLPERTDLKPLITGRLEQPDCVVEKLQFQSLPGLYVTANLFLPKAITKPVPGILYVCGHALVKTNGLSCGNKAGYQHHGFWFARHGYAALLIDTVQLGEIEGVHHGTYREGMWWWNARGYTPAGVEAWNSMRALDYLQTRPEVDASRLGITGRSGGGSYSWTTAAIDDRIKVAAPVAGITDLHNHVVDGCVEGHCDCMFFVNTHRWDFPLNAALIAPRPLLIVNTDADTIFPLDGVVRTHAKVRRIYELYGKPDQLGLVIGPGPHKDTQDLQVPVLRWFNQHLKGEDPPIEDAAVQRVDPLTLRALTVPPPDAINPRIHENFVGAAAGPVPSNVLSQLRERCFGGWPVSEPALGLRMFDSRVLRGLRLSVHEFDSQPGMRLRLWIAEPSRGSRAVATTIHALGTNEWVSWTDTVGRMFDRANGSMDPGIAARMDRLATELRENGQRRIWLAARGVGPEPWPVGGPAGTHLRRRFMLLGQTLEGMRVWDIRRGVRVAQSLFGRRSGPITITATGPMAVNALYASLFEPDVRELGLGGLPASHREGPDYLNVLRILDIPDTLDLARKKSLVRVGNE